MDVKEMLERENLPLIMCQTMEHFFKDVYRCDVRLSTDRLGDSIPLYLMSRPGFLIGNGVTRDAYRTIFTEYTLRGSFVRFLAAKAFIALRLLTKKRNAAAVIYAKTDEPGKLRNILIAPNNKSVRVFSYQTGTVFNIVKSGFKTDFLRNHVEFRKQFKYSFILPLRASGEDWFEEDILTGHPLARVRDERAYQESLNCAVQDISQLFQDTQYSIDRSEYFQGLLSQIAHFLQSLPLKPGQEKKFLGLLELFRRKEADFSGQMLVGYTHGDFQTGNIWRDENGKTWIYDWETAEIRSPWYDCAVMFGGLRREKDYAAFLREDATGWLDSGEETTAKMLIILEDIIFQLREASVLNADAAEKFITHMWDMKCASLEEL